MEGKMSRTSFLLLMLLPMMAVSVYADSGSYSDFLFLIDDMGYFRDSTVWDGPVRSNGVLFIRSYTPDRDNDPWFYTLTTALDSIYTILPDTFLMISSTLPHPLETNLWVEPYELMCEGPPWFNLGTDTIPFGPDNVNWQSTYYAAVESGLCFTSVASGTRMVLESDSIHLRETPDGPVLSYCINDLSEPVVWIDNAPGDDIYIRSIPPDSGSGITVPVTLGCGGSVYIMGDILYEPLSGGMLGLITVYGDLLIADTPVYEPWEGIWAIETEKDMLCSASMLMISGLFEAENPWEPHPAVDFTIFGGIQLVTEYITAYISGPLTWGYFIEHDFDERLFDVSPPFYPTYDTGTGIEENPAILITEPLLQIQGNPFHDNLVLSITADISTTHNVYLLDLSGRRVRESSIRDTITLQTGDLPCGTYILLVESPDGIHQSYKVVKL